MIDVEKFPQFGKISNRIDEVEHVHEFLKWLDDKGVIFMKSDLESPHNVYIPADEVDVSFASTGTILAAYFDVDLEGLEEEQKIVVDFFKGLGEGLFDEQISE
jgi:hypothetical protein